jgi:hypothetical protein
LQSRISIDTGYDYILPTFSLMGLGIGLTMSPMSTAAMNAVQETKAGVASGILSMSRMVGGTFGVAAVGALFQAISDHQLHQKLGELPLSAQQQAWFANNLGSGSVDAKLKQLDPATAHEVGRVLKETFVHSLSSSLKLSTAVAASGVVLALLTLRSGRAHAPAPATAPATAVAEPG